MPRTGRGGTRVGAPGVAYGNRSDLNAPPTGGKLDLSAAPNQPYGQAGQQLNSQRAVPMGTPAVAPPPPQPGPPGTAPGPQGPPPVTPDQVTALHAPTQRPDEPVTAGLATGPGAGPDAVSMGPLPTAPQNTPRTGRDMLASLAATPGAPTAVRALAQLAQSTA